MADGTLKVGTIPTSSGSGTINISPAVVFDVGTSHTIQTFTSGSGTYTTPTNCRAIWVRCVGAGGGGGGSGTGGQTTGSAGGNTTFGSLSALGGAGGPHSQAGGLAGAAQGASGGEFN